MFKKLTKKSKKEEKPERIVKFKEPQIKASREIKTHIKERTEIEKIFYVLTTQKRRTAFRQIIELPTSEVQKNVYMLLEALLKTLIADRSIDKLFYTCFAKIIRIHTSNHDIRNESNIKKLIVDYLIAQLVCDCEYLDFLEFLMRHFKDIVIDSKNKITDILKDEKMKKRISSLKTEPNHPRIKSTEAFYFTRLLN